MPSPLGEFTRARRTELGFSLYEAAVPSGLTPTGVQAIECGRTVNPSIRTLAGLARGLDVPVNDLVDLALRTQS